MTNRRHERRIVLAARLAARKAAQRQAQTAVELNRHTTRPFGAPAAAGADDDESRWGDVVSYKIRSGQLEKRGAQPKARTGSEADLRSWATGSIKVVANDVDCFTWTGTKQDAIDLQKRFPDAANTFGANCQSYAKRAAGYLMLHACHRPVTETIGPAASVSRGTITRFEVYKAAVLWSALREHVPSTGQKLEDVFVGKSRVVVFDGDKEGIIEDTRRELRGEPPSGKEFTIMVGVLDEKYRLDPRGGIEISFPELVALTGKSVSASESDKPIYVPRIPVDAAEATAMLKMFTVWVDATDPAYPRRDYAGYTEDELLGGKPGVRIARDCA